MLGNIWSWPGSPNGDEKNRSQLFSAAPSGSSIGLFGEDLLAADKNEDEIADALLTQFPGYGSRPTAVVLPEGRVPTAEEWLRIGIDLTSPDDDNDEKKDQFDLASQNWSSAQSYTSALATVASVVSGSRAPTPQKRTSTATTASVTEPAASQVVPTSDPVGDLSWDTDEQNLWRTTKSGEESPEISPSNTAVQHTSRTTDHRPTNTTTTTHAVTISPSVTLLRSLSSRKLGPDRQHWMPDQLCNQCYACATQFTVFRRRHHCRICGQVFCNSCAAHFVPSSSGSTIRVCQFCFRQVQEQGGKAVLELEEEEALNNTTVRLGGAGGGIVPLANLYSNQTVSSPKAPLSLIETSVTQPDETHDTVEGTEVIAHLTTNENTPPRAEDCSLNDSFRDGCRHLGMTAANHLEVMAEHLLEQHAPTLWKGIESNPDVADVQKKQWINQLLSLATRCCSQISPNVLKGDFLDIRPYCKLKVIAGGSLKDCAYLSGVLFRKQVSHKKMATKGEVENPRIMLMSGGIEFNREENQLASLETIFEQEDKYMEILVGKILKLRPDVLLVSRSVSRRAQELLLKFDVVLVQHVKSSLLNRIARQTGATVISTTDHVMAQFGVGVLGKCRRFRLVAFRDNEIWVDGRLQGNTAQVSSTKRSVTDTLNGTNVSPFDREAALAAHQLGENVVDGSVAVKSGLAKRGVANTYVLIEGCPKHLGCTIVLRGASTAALKQVKLVLRFLVNVAYSLRLETCYLRERGARLPSDFKVSREHIFSSSLAVDFGKPVGRQVRPWNGGGAGEETPRPDSGDITAFDHQSILITSVWMTDKSQCCPAEVKGICYYSLQDVALGQFLRDSCFNLSLKCQNPNCKKSVLDHSLSFVHNDGLITITVEEMDSPLPQSGKDGEDGDSTDSGDDEEESSKPIATWTYCKKCEKVVTEHKFISEETWKFSFGKFLEVFFYNRDAVLNAPACSCSCSLQSDTVLYFGCGKLAARFDHERIAPYGVYVRKTLPIALGWHRAEAMRRLEMISVASSTLFEKFERHISRVSREARSLFNSAVAVNRPDHLQTIISELNRIGSEVDLGTRTIQERIASITDSSRQADGPSVSETLLRFPWLARRYLFMLMSVWNEKLSAIGQVITSMKKLASVIRTNAATSVVSDPLLEEIRDGMKGLKALNERYARYNVTDITQSLPSLPDLDETPEGDFEDDYEEPDTTMDFSDGVDADVLASRRRLQTAKHSSLAVASRGHGSRSKHSRGHGDPRDEGDSAISLSTKSTPGGAVKSAITRLFNRGGRDDDPYVVNLGMFGVGRPRLSPGINGVIFPVLDDQLSTIIAYSLVTPEYAKWFKHFAKSDNTAPEQEGVSDDKHQSQQAVTVGGETGQIDNKKGTKKTEDDIAFNRQPAPSSSTEKPPVNAIERRMLNRKKSHIKVTFRDYDEKGRVACKFVCTSYWATQFQAVREVFLSPSRLKVDETEDSTEYSMDTEQSYIESLSSANSWAASGGKSGATFARTSDDRFVIKHISRTELQMFLECSSAYFEYLSKAFFHGLPTVLCKIVGVYQLAIHNRVTGKESKSQIAVMQNIFYNKKISKIFDLKGSLRGRFASNMQRSKDDSFGDSQSDRPSLRRRASETLSDDASGRLSEANSVVDSETKTVTNQESDTPVKVYLDGDFLDFTCGRPMPLTDRAKSLFQMGILNDTLFLSIINVLDYSILVGVDAENNELVVGIIDFMRQYDILKQMERVGKSLPMVVGSEAPTIIQPPLYKARFTNAMERYFMTVPSKWTTI